MTTYDDQIEIERLVQQICDREEAATDNARAWEKACNDKRAWNWDSFTIGVLIALVIPVVFWGLVHLAMGIGR